MGQRRVRSPHGSRRPTPLHYAHHSETEDHVEESGLLPFLQNVVVTLVFDMGVAIASAVIGYGVWVNAEPAWAITALLIGWAVTLQLVLYFSTSVALTQHEVVYAGHTTRESSATGFKWRSWKSAAFCMAVHVGLLTGYYFGPMRLVQGLGLFSCLLISSIKLSS